MMARLSDRDAARWQAVGDRVVGLIERALGPEVLGNRSGSRVRWSPSPLPAAIRRAGRLAARLAGASDALVRTDVADFYGSVTPAVLYRSLRRVGADPREAAVAAGLVEGWGSGRCRGLPIGPTTSALLANAVLRPLDEAIGTFPYLRWVDDVLIAASEPRIDEALERVDEALAGLGLHRSREKTSISRDGVVWLGASLMAPDRA